MDPTLKLLVSSVESMPFSEVYKEWCEAGYNIVRLPTKTVILEWRPGMREHPQLIHIVSAQVRQAGFDTIDTRNWRDRHDLRLGVVIHDMRPEYARGEMGEISFKILAHTWIEVWIRAQYLLHLLGVDSHYKD